MFINNYLPGYLFYCEAQKRLNSKTIKASEICDLRAEDIDLDVSVK